MELLGNPHRSTENPEMQEDSECRRLAENPSERRLSIQIADLGKSRHSIVIKPRGSSGKPQLSSEMAAQQVGNGGTGATGSMLSAPLGAFAREGLTGTDEDGDTALVDEQGVASEEDAEDVESSKHHSLELQVEMLRGKLSRRNMIIEVIRRAYYHDVILVKEELRQTKLTSGKDLPPQQHNEDRLSVVPSVDLRDALALFAPAETVLQVHPCESCGGHLELVHGEVGTS